MQSVGCPTSRRFCETWASCDPDFNVVKFVNDLGSFAKQSRR